MQVNSSTIRTRVLLILFYFSQVNGFLDEKCFDKYKLPVCFKNNCNALQSESMKNISSTLETPSIIVDVPTLAVCRIVYWNTVILEDPKHETQDIPLVKRNLKVSEHRVTEIDVRNTIGRRFSDRNARDLQNRELKDINTETNIRRTISSFDRATNYRQIQGIDTKISVKRTTSEDRYTNPSNSRTSEDNFTSNGRVLERQSRITKEKRQYIRKFRVETSTRRFSTSFERNNIPLEASATRLPNAERSNYIGGAAGEMKRTSKFLNARSNDNKREVNRIDIASRSSSLRYREETYNRRSMEHAEKEISSRQRENTREVNKVDISSRHRDEGNNKKIQAPRIRNVRDRVETERFTRRSRISYHYFLARSDISAKRVTNDRRDFNSRTSSSTDRRTTKDVSFVMSSRNGVEREISDRKMEGRQEVNRRNVVSHISRRGDTEEITNRKIVISRIRRGTETSPRRSRISGDHHESSQRSANRIMEDSRDSSIRTSGEGRFSLEESSHINDRRNGRSLEASRTSNTRYSEEVTPREINTISRISNFIKRSHDSSSNRQDLRSTVIITVSRVPKVNDRVEANRNHTRVTSSTRTIQNLRSSRGHLETERYGFLAADRRVLHSDRTNKVTSESRIKLVQQRQPADIEHYDGSLVAEARTSSSYSSNKLVAESRMPKIQVDRYSRHQAPNMRATSRDSNNRRTRKSRVSNVRALLEIEQYATRLISERSNRIIVESTILELKSRAFSMDKMPDTRRDVSNRGVSRRRDIVGRQIINKHYDVSINLISERTATTERKSSSRVLVNQRIRRFAKSNTRIFTRKIVSNQRELQRNVYDQERMHRNFEYDHVLTDSSKKLGTNRKILNIENPNYRAPSKGFRGILTNGKPLSNVKSTRSSVDENNNTIRKSGGISLLLNITKTFLVALILVQIIANSSSPKKISLQKIFSFVRATEENVF